MNIDGFEKEKEGRTIEKRTVLLNKKALIASNI